MQVGSFDSYTRGLMSAHAVASLANSDNSPQSSIVNPFKGLTLLK